MDGCSLAFKSGDQGLLHSCSPTASDRMTFWTASTVSLFGAMALVIGAGCNNVVTLLLLCRIGHAAHRLENLALKGHLIRTKATELDICVLSSLLNEVCKRIYLMKISTSEDRPYCIQRAHILMAKPAIHIITLLILSPYSRNFDTSHEGTHGAPHKYHR